MDKLFQKFARIILKMEVNIHDMPQLNSAFYMLSDAEKKILRSWVQINGYHKFMRIISNVIEEA